MISRRAAQTYSISFTARREFRVFGCIRRLREHARPFKRRSRVGLGMGTLPYSPRGRQPAAPVPCRDPPTPRDDSALPAPRTKSQGVACSCRGGQSSISDIRALVRGSPARRGRRSSGGEKSRGTRLACRPGVRLTRRCPWAACGCCRRTRGPPDATAQLRRYRCRHHRG
jgi:hypothetical protein